MWTSFVAPPVAVRHHVILKVGLTAEGIFISLQDYQWSCVSTSPSQSLPCSLWSFHHSHLVDAWAKSPLSRSLHSSSPHTHWTRLFQPLRSCLWTRPSSPHQWEIVGKVVELSKLILPRSAVFNSVGTPTTCRDIFLVSSCNHKYFASKWFIRPTPCHCGYLQTPARCSPSARPRMHAMNSASHELSEIVFCVLDHDVTKLLLRKIITLETECLLVFVELLSSAQSLSDQISNLRFSSPGTSLPNTSSNFEFWPFEYGSKIP